MIKQTLFLVLITLIPALELRASIPYGILGKANWGIDPELMSWPVVAAVCVIANIILGWTVFTLMSPAMAILARFTWFNRWIDPILRRARNKLHPYVEKYGEIGVAVFIGIPLPGSGVYTGAVGAHLLGLERRKFWIANVIGVLIAGSAVTVLTLLVRAGMQLPWLDWILKH